MIKNKKPLTMITVILLIIAMFPLSPKADAAEKTFEQYIISNVEAFSPTIDITDYVLENNWTGKEAMSAYQQVIKDNPQLFYVSGAVSYSAILSGSTGSVKSATLKNLGYNGSKDEIQKQIKAFNTAADKAMAEIDDGMTDAEKALALHDYLVVNCGYDLKLKNYDAYDCLVTGSAVCQGYSLAYQYLLTRAGVECRMVSSDSMNHAWNYVKIGNDWYHVDVTMDDPLFTDNGKQHDFFGNVSHEFLLMSDSAIKKASHPHKGWSTGGLPAASSTAFDGAFWKDSDSTMAKYGKYWYCLKLDKSSPGLDYNSTKSGEIRTNLYRYTFETGKSSLVYTLNSSWKSWENKNSWYMNSYARLAEKDGMIYFNSPDSIYKYDIAKNTIGVYLTPTNLSGRIYGLAVIDGKITFTVKTSPSGVDSLLAIS